MIINFLIIIQDKTMGKVIGKVIATEKNPSTIDNFYFWTKQDMILNPFDVVKIGHLENSVSYGVIEEISHITDTANFLSDYISNDFGQVNTTERTHRIGMNYVKASVIGNNKNIYIPLLNDAKVELAEEEEIAEALGLNSVCSLSNLFFRFHTTTLTEACSNELKQHHL